MGVGGGLTICHGIIEFRNRSDRGRRLRCDCPGLR